MSQSPLLRVENLHTGFDTEEGVVQAVDGISFHINEGEIFGLVGESGSGKSVTAMSILQLLDQNGQISADRIEFKGSNLLDKTEAEMRSVRGGEISMIFQNPMGSLNPVLSIGEQIAEVFRHHGDTDESTGLFSELRRKYVTGTRQTSPSWQKAIELLGRAGISDPETRAEQYPHQLSGGMRQRAMIAQALAGDPSLIIADEPTTALDVSIEAQILDELTSLCQQFDVSILFITHDLGVVRQTCERVAVMYAGELMEQGVADEIFEKPKHPYTHGLLRSLPNINEDKEWLDPIEGSVPDLTDKPPGCPFAERCEREFNRCDRPLTTYQLSEKHSVNCHLYDPSNNHEQDISIGGEQS
jgi:peptide/nickel transport system ATP-binding protein